MRRRVDTAVWPAYDCARWVTVDAWWADALAACRSLADLEGVFDAWCDLQPPASDPRVA